MNHLALIRRLWPLSETERVEVLKKDGFTDDMIHDFLASFMSSAPIFSDTPVKKAIVPMAQDPVWLTIEERAKALAEKSALNPPTSQRGDGLTALELDVLHNRYLLGGSTEFDSASFHNPKLIQTEALKWLRYELDGVSARCGILFGDHGTGKTWAGLCWLNAKATFDIKSFRVIQSNAAFVEAYRLSEMVANTKDFKRELELFRQVEWLLIDDLGTEPRGYKGGDFIAYFDNLISIRHKFRRCKTLMTSNATPAQFKEIYGDRVVSRFNDVGLFKEVKDVDYRSIKGKDYGDR